jgi:radical SAM superfamily enzyme YgiQ (UPF0313 family)
MEPLAPAVIAGLTPRDVTVRFYDDRLEPIPYDEPTDLVALSVETYTALRSYQIASEYRRRGIPVVMGGFHATLCTEEVAQFAEAVVVGEAEGLWPEVLDDFRRGRPKQIYRQAGRPSLAGVRNDRSIFRGKRYLPISLIEAGRGCHLRCDFCAIQSYYDSTQVRRPIDAVLEEIRIARRRANFFFFVDDNIGCNLEQAKEFYRALAPLNLRWVSQASIDVAHDEEFLDLISRSGCEGLLIGFESLDPANLKQMNKSFNTMRGGYDVALANLKRHDIRVYGTFVFGYDHDDAQAFAEALTLARRHSFYIAAFNHLTPFPGTPLYRRMEQRGQLLYGAWWTDPRYGYNEIPFKPKLLEPEELQRLCLETRAAFYSLSSTLRRFGDRLNRSNALMAWYFPLINLMVRREITQRDGLPLGDEGLRGDLLSSDRPLGRVATKGSCVAS